MNRFLMLMRREWMQHRIGWLVVMLAPTVLLLLGSLIDDGLQININDQVQMMELRQAPPLIITGLLVTAVTGLTLALALLSMAFQLPGLARRDQQDGSAEFWTSLPVGHAQAIAATLFTQILLLPWLAIIVGIVGGLVAAVLGIIAIHGPLAWLAQPWGLLALSALSLLLRMTVALLVAMAWVSPLLLLTMAASAWLRRWGVPVVAALTLAGTLIVDKRLPEPLVGPLLWRPIAEALHALLYFDAVRAVKVRGVQDVVDQMPGLPQRLLADLPAMLGGLLSPAFALALAGGALGFALLVLRRQRGG